MNLKNLLNEMAAINNVDAVVKLIKAGKFPEAVAEMLKEKQLKVVPGNLASMITPQEKAAFSLELKKVNPSLKRGPGIKAAENKIEKAVTTKITSSQNQDSIKKKLLNVLIKATKEIQSDPKISEEEKKLSNEALEILKDSLFYTMKYKKGLYDPKVLEVTAENRQSKILDSFLRKNAPAALEKAKLMALDHREEIEEYIKAKTDFIEKMKKEEGRTTTPALDIKKAFDSGLLRRTSGFKEEDLDTKLGTDDETINKEIKKEEKKASEKFPVAGFDKASKEKIAIDKDNEAKRAKKVYDEAVKKGASEKQIANLKIKMEGAIEVAKIAKSDLVKEVWNKRQKKGD